MTETTEQVTPAEDAQDTLKGRVLCEAIKNLTSAQGVRPTAKEIQVALDWKARKFEDVFNWCKGRKWAGKVPGKNRSYYVLPR